MADSNQLNMPPPPFPPISLPRGANEFPPKEALPKQRHKQPPPEQKSKPLPNLEFLRKATVLSLVASEDNLSALRDASSWFEGAYYLIKTRMELAKDIHEGCTRVVGVVEALKAMEKSMKEDFIYLEKMGLQEATIRTEPVDENTSDKNGTGINTNGTALAALHKLLDRADQNGGGRDIMGPMDDIADYDTLMRQAIENIDNLRVLRGKWQAGGKNLEDITGLRQSKPHFARKVMN